MSILIVDDMPQERILLQHLLNKGGFTDVRLAASPAEAFDFLGMNASAPSTGVDLILMDFIMPGMDGIEACRRIKDRGYLRNIPIIMVTAVSDLSHLQLAFDAGVMDYIVKPVKKEELLARVRSLLRLKRQEDALRESEARYRAIVEDQTELICRFKPDGTLTFVNDACCRYYGRKHEELVGQSFMLFVPEHERSVVRKLIASLHTKRPVVSTEHRVVMPSGEIRWQRWTDRAIFNEFGELIELQSVGQDITERKELEEELARAQKLESIAVLAGGVAHDFNNILTVIIGNICLAQKLVEPGSDVSRRLKIIETAATQAGKLTRQLVDFSHNDRPAKQSRSIRELIHEAVAAALEGSLLECRFSAPNDLWPVDCDPEQIRRMATNLIVNAREASPPGGVIEVELTNERLLAGESPSIKEGDYVRISIRDYGAGIQEEHIPKIFDPYFSTKQRGAEKGMGLGLTIAYSIINKHGGYINVKSEPGQGATFQAYLPVSEMGEGG